MLSTYQLIEADSGISGSEQGKSCSLEKAPTNGGNRGPLECPLTTHLKEPLPPGHPLEHLQTGMILFAHQLVVYLSQLQDKATPEFSECPVPTVQ